MNLRLGITLLIVALSLVGFWFVNENSGGDGGDLSGHERSPSGLESPELEEVLAQAPSDTAQSGEDLLATESEREIMVASAPSPSVPGSVIRGTVRDEQGEDVPAFRLTARFKPKTKGAKWEDRDLGAFMDGEFLLRDLEEGRWRLEPSAEGYLKTKLGVFRVPHSESEVAIVMARHCILEGLVQNPNGNPVEGAQVLLQGQTFSQEEEIGVNRTDGEGRFRLTIPPGPYVVMAQDDFFAASQSVRGELESGQVAEISLQLQLGARLEGVVKNHEGELGAEWTVEIKSTEWALDRRAVKADSQGKFVLEHLAPGTYWAQARPGSKAQLKGRPIRETLEMVAGETTHLVLGGVSETSITVTGTVYRDGVPSPKARVWAQMEGAKSFSSGMTTVADETGHFEVYYPEGGRANFLVAAKEGHIIPIPIVLSDEREQTIDIHIPNGKISGTVVQPGEGKFRRRTVKCWPEGLNPIHSFYLSRNVRCDADGQFAFHDLPEGVYRVRIANVLDPRSVVEDILVESGGHAQGIKLVVGATGKARVQVLDKDQQPVQGASIFVQDAQGNAHSLGINGKTNSKGEYQFSKLGVGEYRFFASHGDFASKLSELVQVESGTEHHQVVHLVPGARGKIRVLDQGEPVSAQLWILNDAGQEFSRTMASFDHPTYLREGLSTAEYSIGPLLPGRYLVRARTLDGRKVKGEMVLKTAGVTRIDLELEP